MNSSLRPHVKTHKCVEVARLQTEGCSGGLTVSTLAEAEAFSKAGFQDITYAVPIDPGKFDRAIEISRNCKRFSLLTDDLDVVEMLNARAQNAGVTLSLFLKIDCGYHRCGVAPDSPEAIEISRRISDTRCLRFAGILTHAGQSYSCRTPDETLEVAHRERDVMVECADQLRSAGVDVPVVSIGSTPTIVHVDRLDGIDEVRPGNYIFFDEFQAARGNCSVDDCPLSVLAAIVHLDRSRRRVVIDAGAIALSKDRGAVDLDPDVGYGRVLDLQGTGLGLRVVDLSQEHGEISVSGDVRFDRLKVGSRVRIAVNHSCLTAAQHDRYHVLEGERVIDEWQIHRGW